MSESLSTDRRLNEFAEQLMKVVRDRSIASIDRTAAGIKGPQGERWSQALAHDNARHAVLDLTPDIVDHVLFEFLNAVDNDELRLSFTDSTGTTTPLEALGKGELAGWLMMSGGWRQLHSASRSNDDFADLALKKDWVERRPD